MARFRRSRFVTWIRRSFVDGPNTTHSKEAAAHRELRDELARLHEFVEERLSAQQRIFESCLVQQRSLLLNVENGLMNKIVEAGQKTDNFQNLVVNQIEAVRQTQTNDLLDLRRSLISAEIHGRLSAHPPFDAIRDVGKSSCLPLPLTEPTLDATFRMLEIRYPRLFPVYRELLEAGERSYQANPRDSVSVYDNPGAVTFRAFCLPNLRGTVLDIGCGPVPVPIYLQGYDLALVAGIDPFGAAEQHPFVFVRAVAEGIPWTDESFDTLVVATSFDHFFDLSLGLREMARVLKPNGELIAWVYYVPGMPPYDPSAEGAGKIDEFHLFHLDKPWFLQTMAPHFTVLEELNIDGFSHFYRFLRKPYH